MPPRRYRDLLAAGIRPNKHFRIRRGNLENIRHCLLVAPHGGRIEPGTTRIVLAVTRLHRWAYYCFDGCLLRNNWRKLHIASTSYDVPTLLELLPRTQFVVSFHGESNRRERVIYVGGLYREGRERLLAALAVDLRDLDIRVRDATIEIKAEEIAGLSPRNMTNRGATGQGVQLEFSYGARQVFVPGLSRRAQKRPVAALGILAQSVDRVLLQLTRRL